MRAVIVRGTSDDKQTLGTLELFDDANKKVFGCKTLELDWQNNERQQSCIPKGTYNITPRTSSKYGSHFLINNVPGRSAILIHHGNYHKDILGCILVGTNHTDINGDGYKDVTSSKATLKKLIQLAPKGFTLTVK